MAGGDYHEFWGYGFSVGLTWMAADCGAVMVQCLIEVRVRSRIAWAQLIYGRWLIDVADKAAGEIPRFGWMSKSLR